jgi:hypothetical protein
VGKDAFVWPESAAAMNGLTNTDEQHVSAGFQLISTAALATGGATAYFFWNLTWDESLSVPACTGASAPHANATISLIANVYDATSTTYVGQVAVIIHTISTTTCGSTASNSQNTLLPETIQVAFTATSGNTYDFDSELWAQTFAECNGCTPGTVSVTASANAGGSPYYGAISAGEVY